ncbi:DNA polymerase III subunit delta' [Providencia rustigianii]|uniref:DNA polymerase III subunit delta' n=1 Tax=Providencia rustigianii TaxID=158850 RepID=UPI000F6E6906|nr:DNA polymerase III subunit delta' [Providencia rustigianii]MTC59262.1 DNA polymerase III subunit delta' [Providencia rustigianii]VEH55744.1 DNA polymerase III subunit delta' [Providencia rustigianii]
MNWYPWLNDAYRQLIGAYQAGRGHHALLIHSIAGNGADALSYGMSRWLICQNKDGLKSCGECHSCRLMLAGTHPDYHVLDVEKGKSTISIDAVRKLTETLSGHAQQNGAKVVAIPNGQALTDAAANALLKTLEEPSKQTYFLLGCEKPENLLATLRSRCLTYFLSAPAQEIALYWLQKQMPEVNVDDAVTALKLSQGAPIAALQLLEPQHWQKRTLLCNELEQSLRTKDFLRLLPALNTDNAPECISWLLGVLSDSIKIQQKASQFCVNQDQIGRVTLLATTMSSSQLLDLYGKWQDCRHQLLTVPALNQELILSNQLLQWEALFASPSR